MRRKKSTTKKRLAPKKGVFNGIEYDSLEELGILQWLYELKAQGYIKSIKRADSYLLCDSVVNNYAMQAKKVSSRPMTQTLLQGHSYTPEFMVCWAGKAKEKFLHNLNVQKKYEAPKFVTTSTTADDWETIIEVKPSFDQNNMERLFKLNQKWMWDKHKLFVNLIKINELFPKTFTPKAYLVTPTGRQRQLKWKAKTLFNYVNGK